ncbi:uncharacterized protein [Ambystoma mexicanum]|uniref:uncharacterized protein n=1 Tax=Ambystoma mexicanum TaxID=8296 RepID=UPI0037E78E35
MPDTILKISCQDHDPKNDQAHEAHSLLAGKCNILAASSRNAGALWIHESVPAVSEVPNMVSLATLQRLEEKIDHLQNTMAGMPVKVAELMKQMWLTRAENYLKDNVASVEIPSPVRSRDSNVSTFPGEMGLSLQPVFPPEVGEQEDHCVQPGMTSGQHQRILCAQTVFTDERSQQWDQCMQPVLPNVDDQQHNQCIKDMFPDKQNLSLSQKLEPLCPDDQEQEEMQVRQSRFSDEPSQELSCKLEPLYPDEQNCELEPVVPVGYDVDQDDQLEPVSPDDPFAGQEHNFTPLCPTGHCSSDALPSLGSDTLPVDGAVFTASLVTRNEDSSVLKAAPERWAITKTKRLRADPRWSASAVQRKKRNVCEVGLDQSTARGKKSTCLLDSQTLGACTESGESFTYPSNITEHLGCPIKEKSQKCTYCGKRFTQHSQLMVHLRNCFEEQAFPGRVIGKYFPNRSNLILEKRSHRGERPYKCNECEKFFTLRCNLYTHQRIHTGERPYRCTACDRSFTLKSTLIKHQRTHTGERPFQCTACEKSYTQKSSLDRHQRIHTGHISFLDILT